MELEITPEPGEAERRAVAAALALDEAEQEPDSLWAAASLPQREEPDP